MTIVATAPVPAQRRLDTSTTEPLPAATIGPCPEWCHGGCCGVDPDDNDGARLHDSKITLVRGTGSSVDDEVFVQLSRLDTPAAGIGQPTVYLEGGPAYLTAQEAVLLAKALVDHANRIRAAGVGEVLMYRAETN